MNRAWHGAWPALLATALSSCSASGNQVPLLAYGSVEARQVRVASRTGGRVLRVLVDENDAVVPGQPLVEIDVRELEAQRDQARAALGQAVARERLLVHGARREDVVEAEKALAAARARLEQARLDLRRAEELRAGEAIPVAGYDAARTAADLAESDAAARRAELEKVVGGARAEELEEAAAARALAEAALVAAEDRVRDRMLEAPTAGVVIHRMVEPGEVARAATPLLVIAELSRPYLDVYVPEPRLAEARLGAPAEVRVDALPGRSFRGTVSHVAAEAEFTPKNVQTAEQRARLVFRVRVDVDDPGGQLRPGMPGSATFGTAGAARPDGGPLADGKRKS
ncbi:MAG TPA: efflux RND transporter periplasmic adaptor subunit [Anaeromyxobacteraceae bacterium]|nr:efflux RND transporter periplasmic adaptor subunit [Anaeromyxobacteraceae bacterium]